MLNADREGAIGSPQHDTMHGAKAMREDPMDLALFPKELADILVMRYRTQLFPQWPFIPLHPDITSHQLRNEKPTLFLAVLAAASGSSYPSLFRTLNVELLRRFADMVVIENKKTIELIQSMLIVAVWPFPPDHFKDLNYSQYMHLAATMAMDLGLGDTPTEIDQRQALDPSRQSMFQKTNSEWELMEKRRTMLGCFLLSSGSVFLDELMGITC